MVQFCCYFRQDSGIETVSCRLLLRMAMMNDGHGFKLQKILHPFIYVFILLQGKMPTCENYKPFAGSSINK